MNVLPVRQVTWMWVVSVSLIRMYLRFVGGGLEARSLVRDTSPWLLVAGKFTLEARLLRCFTLLAATKCRYQRLRKHPSLREVQHQGRE